MELGRVYLEISNICNLSCPFCSAVTRPPRRMSCGEFDHIIAANCNNKLDTPW